MTIIDVELLAESRSRYLTYALSVVSSRALPDVRDGLKPVQRRILYAMERDLRIGPDKHHRKSAAVVGEVLAKYHPHGDAACYEAMVRMAQDFSLRYPLVDGQGNFGSLDGDSAAAYRYTEARLTNLAIELVGDITEETVAFRDNFDQTTKEPVVFPTRVPNLLINGASGIAVGLATSIPPHNLREVIKGLLLLIEDPDTPDSKLFAAIKAPDFPTGCAIVNSKAELRDIYETGRGAIRMRGTYEIEELHKGRLQIVITSVPYGLDKSSLVEKIADLIIARKVPQLEDIRDESTEVVRVVMELAEGADPEVAMTYLFKHTPLQTNFNVNLTGLVPTDNPYVSRPERLSLRQMLTEFLKFRVEVVRAKLEFERRKLLERIHLLEGLVIICDALDEAINLIRKSKGRSDAAERLQKRFALSSEQSFFVVDLRLYQLAQTAIAEVRMELEEKQQRVAEIVKILSLSKLLHGLISSDLQRIADTYGDARKSQIEHDVEEPEFDAEAYVQHEDVHVIVTKDGWLKRIRVNNDPISTRTRDGDSVFFTAQTSTRYSLAMFTNQGNIYVTKIHDLLSTSGFGEPVQKLFRFADGEQIVTCQIDDPTWLGDVGQFLAYTNRGLGFYFNLEMLAVTKKTGKKLMRLGDGDVLAGIVNVRSDMLLLVSERGYGLPIMSSEIPALSGAGKGVILQKMPDDDALKLVIPVKKNQKVTLVLEKDAKREVDLRALTISVRAKRGSKLYKTGGKVVGYLL